MSKGIVQLRRKTAAHLLAALCALFVATIPCAYAQDARWIADSRTGCRVWDLSPRDGETIVWDGSCVNGFGQGPGTLKWFERNGTLIETDTANFIHGKFNGHVIINEWWSGEHFEGEFRDHKPNGPGTLVTGDGEVYSGRWVEGCFRDKTRQLNYGVPREACQFSSDAARLKRFALR